MGAKMTRVRVKVLYSTIYIVICILTREVNPCRYGYPHDPWVTLTLPRVKPVPSEQVQVFWLHRYGLLQKYPRMT